MFEEIACPLSVSARARAHHSNTLGAVLSYDRGVVAQAVESTFDRIGMQASRAVDVLPEPGDGAAFTDGTQAAGSLFSDEQQYGIGADVDGGDAHEGFPWPGGRRRLGCGELAPGGAGRPD